MNPENLTLLEANNLPAGSVIEESPDYEGDPPAALTKQGDDEWTCDKCDEAHSLSGIYRSDLTYSLKSLGELPKGFVFGLSNLELSAFAPEGTLVSDQDNDGAVWERIGNEWYNGVTHEDRIAEAENWRVSRNGGLGTAWAPYTVVAPEKKAESKGGLSAEDATGLTDKILKDREGDLWRFHDGEWQFSNSAVDWIALPSSRYALIKDYEPFTIQTDDGELSEVEAEKLTDKVLRDRTGDLWKMIDGKWNFSVGGSGIFTPFLGYRSDGLHQMFAPYEVVEAVKDEGLTVEDLLKNPDRLYYDSEGDLWGCRDGMWAWGVGPVTLERKLSGTLFLHPEPFSGDIEPYRVAEGVSLPEPEAEPEEEKAPTTTETWLSIAASLERIANALEEK